MGPLSLGKRLAHDVGQDHFTAVPREVVLAEPKASSREVRITTYPNGFARPPAVRPSARTFAAWLDDQFRSVTPPAGTYVTLAGVARRHEDRLDGRVEAACGRGFVIHGHRYRAFIAYRDLYAREGRVRILEPVWFAALVDQVNLRAQRRLPGYSAAEHVRLPATSRYVPPHARHPAPARTAAPMVTARPLQ